MLITVGVDLLTVKLEPVEEEVKTEVEEMCAPTEVPSHLIQIKADSQEVSAKCK